MDPADDSAPKVRYLTATRFSSRDGEREGAQAPDQEKPAGNAGVFIMAAVLIVAVGGVIFVGPEKTMDIAKKIVASEKKAVQEAPVGNPPVEEPKPVRAPTARKSRTAAVVERRQAVGAARTTEADAAAAEQVRHRAVKVTVGMHRRELLELYGAPDMKTTSMEGGHLVENFAYLNPAKVQRTIVLQDGQVIGTGAN
jgi:hypothetical protein